MLKLVLILIAFINVTFVSYAQDVEIGLETGIGSYSMKGLKNYNKLLEDNLVFNTALTTDFPSFFYYRPYVIMRLNYFGIGILSSFQSTGSRLTGQDYSGRLVYDMKIKAYTPGIYTDLSYQLNEKIRVNLNSIFGVSFSRLLMSEYFVLLGDVQVDEETLLKSRGFYCEPGSSALFKYNNIGVKINFGYYLSFKNQDFFGNKKLYNPIDQEYIKPEWDGIRYGLSFNYHFKYDNLKN